MTLFVTQTRVVEVPVNTITLAATCQQAMLIDAAGQCVGSTNAMPAFMPTLLEIDLATGQIKNWCVPSCEQLQDIADTSEIQRMSEGEYHHFMNDRLFRNAVPLEQATTPPQTDDCWVDESHMPYGYFDDERDPALLNSAPTLGSTSAPTQVPESAAVRDDLQADCAPADHQSNLVESNQIKPTQREQFAEFLAQRGIEPSAPKPTNQISVEYDHLAEKWTAETLSEVGHIATSTVGKFEAIKNVLKKAGLHGVYEINLIEDGLYGYDGSRTLDADTVYMTQGADGAWSARMPNNRPVSAVIGIDGSLTALLKEMEGIQPEDAVIIETTDDEMRSRNKRRYAVTAKHEHAPVEASTANPVDLPSVAPTPATAEPVADPDDAVPVCTLKKTLDPLPAITDNGDLPSDFDGGDVSDVSDDKLDVTVATRENGEYVATTGAGATYMRASSRTDAEAALKNLLKKCGMIVSDTAIVETTSTYDSVQLKRRFSIDTSFAEPSDSDLANDEIAYSGDTELPEPTATNPAQIDIEEAIAEALARPEPVMDLSQPAPVEAVTKLNMHPSVVLDQLSFASANQADPIYVAFFTARGLMEDGKLSSKGFRLLASLGEARGIGSATQMIENAIEVVEKPATYAEIVALINHATEKMQLVRLIDRIAKHGNFTERQDLYALQKERVDALKADSAA